MRLITSVLYTTANFYTGINIHMHNKAICKTFPYGMNIPHNSIQN